MKNPLERVCAYCGEDFVVKYPSSKKTFCGYSCSVRSQNRVIDQEANPNWRGGKASHPLYQVYVAMIMRCHNPNNKSFVRYGGRGIYVCKRWRKDFWNFVQDMGERPLLNPGSPRPYASIDRIDNDGPYSPGNCRWTDAKTQSANSRLRALQRRDDISGRFVST